jgi:diguanylate cyclase (GGDEF)-like protein
MPHRRYSNPSSPLALIVAAAIGAVLFTVGAGVFVYRTTQNLITAAAWVDHTQVVLTSIQSTSQIIERVEFEARLQLATHDAEQLNAARSNTVRLATAIVHLKSLVADNPAQTRSADELDTCTANLAQAVDRIAQTQTLPRDELLHCRQTLGLMSEQEHRLLRERTDESQHKSLLSINTEVAFIALSLFILVALFVMLFRDALARRRIARRSSSVNAELASTIKTLEDRAQESRLLDTARDELQLCIDVEQLYRAATTSLDQLLPGSSGALCIINNSRHLVEIVASWGHLHATARLPDLFALESCCGLRSGHLRWRRQGVSEIHCSHFAASPATCYLCVPMVARGDTLGTLYIECPTPAIVDLVERRLQGVRQLIQLTAMAVATLQLQNKLENQSIHDALTGLFNRHFMEIALERELARAVRQHTTLAIFMLDVDHFKKFNDRFGHIAGDAVLQQVAKVFQTSVRTDDIACRYGGEEFAIILPDITPETARERAEAIRQKVADLRTLPENFSFGDITISIGVASYPIDGRSPDLLLRKADEALYRAKHQGRNQVTTAALSDPALTLPHA